MEEAASLRDAGAQDCSSSQWAQEDAQKDHFDRVGRTGLYIDTRWDDTVRFHLLKLLQEIVKSLEKNFLNEESEGRGGNQDQDEEHNSCLLVAVVI